MGSALKIATNATNRYVTLPYSNPTVNGLTLYYRSIAEIVLAKHYPNTDYRIKKINANFYDSFEHYVQQLYTKFCTRESKVVGWTQTELQIDPQEFLDCYRQYEHERGLQKLQAWIALQHVAGPVIESLILVDRILYLEEQDENVHTALIPLFDACISPRNLAIVAWKEGPKNDCSGSLQILTATEGSQEAIGPTRGMTVN